MPRESRLLCWDMFRDAWQLHLKLRRQLQPPLLLMLMDSDVGLRQKAVNFWHAALPPMPALRLAALLDTSHDAAEHWVRWQPQQSMLGQL